MVTPNTGPTAFPVNESYAMQQAWRLYFDEENLKGNESYTIEKNYPAECSIMCGRAFKAIGLNVNVRNPAAPFAPLSFVEKVFSKMLDHPYLSVAATCVFITGLSSAVVCIIATIPLYVGVSILSIHVIALAILLIKIKTS
jgi:hypothetical protein